MAYSYTWPAGLPQVPQKGYTEDKGFILIKTSMDAGPAKIRRRGKRPDVLNVSFIMTNTDVDTLQYFVDYTIKGTARFAFPHPRLTTNPRSPVYAEVRIMPQGEGVMYNMSYLAPNYYTVSMQLEVMP
jgi:hypothetical protein